MQHVTGPETGQKAAFEEMASGQTTKPHLWDVAAGEHALSLSLLDPAIADNIIHRLTTIYKGFQQTKNMQDYIFF